MMNDTRAGDVLVENLCGMGSLGVTYDADKDGACALIIGWERLPNGKFGHVQKHGGVHIGDALYSINEIIVNRIPHSEVMAILRNNKININSLKFINIQEHYRRKRGLSQTQTSFNKSKEFKQDSQFNSIIRQSRIQDNTTSTTTSTTTTSPSTTSISMNTDYKSKKYVEYEIACQMRILGSKLDTNTVIKWTIWKRFSQFEKLHQAIVKEFGWRLGSLELPSSHTFVFNKFSVEFIEQRREELNVYWSKLLATDRISDFQKKQHCSVSLFEFLEVESMLNNSTKRMEVMTGLPPTTLPIGDLLNNNNNTNNHNSNNNNRTSTNTNTSTKTAATHRPFQQSRSQPQAPIPPKTPPAMVASPPTTSPTSVVTPAAAATPTIHTTTTKTPVVAALAPIGAPKNIVDMKSNMMAQIKARKKE
eukprot:gene3063-6005_t